MFKIITSILFLLLSSSNLMLGQDPSLDELLLQPTELIDQEVRGQGNDVYIKQKGIENTAEVAQIKTGEENNLARILQTGEYNIIRIAQTGDGNKTAVIQTGNKNLYELNIEGTGNNFTIVQNGDGNSIVQQLTNNTNDVNVEFVQQGNDNEIIQILEGIQSKDFKIHQQGDGLKVIINQSNY